MSTCPKVGGLIHKLAFFPNILYTQTTYNFIPSSFMNSALRARLKHSKKNTKKGKELGALTKKFRRNNYWTKPKSMR